MSKCQMCGKETDSRTKIKVEGAKLSVCDSCSDMGEEVSTRKKRTKKKSNKRSSTPRESKVLINDYGAKVRKARESKELTQSELADVMNEKESRISKIEKEDLKPDKKLGRKLKKHLGVELYTNAEVTNYETPGGSDDRKATLGDIADVKE